MSLPIITPRTILGLRTEIISNVHYITDDQIIYPVGSLIAFQNINEGTQRFIRLPEKGKHVRQLLVSQNKKLVAVSEDGLDKPLVTIYDATTLKKKRTLTIPADKEVTCNYYATIAFTQDSKNLIAVTGDPDWSLFSFKVERGKIESSTRANNANGTGTVIEISCNPNDSNLLVLVGHQLIRIMACSEYSWRQFGFSKADTTTVTSAAWLSQDRLIAGTIEGKIFVVDSGDLKAVYWAGDMPALILKQREDIATTSQTSLSAVDEKMHFEEGEDYQIRCLMVVARGFIFGYKRGTIRAYEKESPFKYVLKHTYFLPDHSVIRDADAEKTYLNDIHYLCTNPAQDRILITCTQSQIWISKLWGPQPVGNGTEIIETTMGLPLHHGKIGGLSICTWRPIFLSSGEMDRTLRIWNYETNILEVCKEFQEDIYDVALHPTGLYALVGFSDKLRFMTVLLDGFQETRAFNIRKCKKCSFSNLGHLFAATNINVIQVYATVTLQTIYVLKGHSGRIRGLSWTANDQQLASCGEDGAVYEWIVASEQRASEVIIKECSFSGTAITSDGKSIYAVGSDGQLRLLNNGNVSREMKLTDATIDGVLLSRADMMMFAAGNEGCMYSIKLPLLDKLEFNEFGVHMTRITNLVITMDDKLILTCSEDGTICIWKVLNAEGKQIKLDKDFKESTDILITREQMEAKLKQIKDLTQRTHEILTEHSYQMRQNDVTHNLRMKEVHEGYCIAIEELKEKNEALEAEHTQEIQNINMEITKMKSGHEVFVQTLEANYNEKLIVEYDKYLRLEEKMARMRMNYEKRLEDLTKAKKDSEEEITNNFLQKLKDKEVHLEEVMIQTQQKVKEHELIKQQIEDDADREIYELKTEHERELKEEQDINVRLRGETGIIKKKLSNAQKEIEDLKHNVYSLQNEHIKFKAIIVGLERDIADLKKEIQERDATIQDKERRIYELKRKNQELEKFKFILDFKIKELKSQIEPRERTIREQTEQINDMVRELENLQRVVINLDLQISELKEKLHSADAELRKEIDRNRMMKNALKTVRMDIHQASGLIQDIPKLTKVLREMYHKYNADKDFAATQQEDVEVKNEFLKQREFLERTVKTLKQQVTGGPAQGSSDKMRLVEENATLIAETNILRADLKLEEKKTKKMESILGLSNKYVLPKVAQKLMSDAVATRAEIEAEFKVKLMDRESRIIALKEENARLLSKIAEQNEEMRDGKKFVSVKSTEDLLDESSIGR